MYAVPLIKKQDGHEYSMGLPIDYQTEIQELTSSLTQTNKAVNIRIEPASIDSFNNLFLVKPKILHLSCHGDYDKRSEQYYLAFESSKELGLLDKLDTNKLGILLKSNEQQRFIECVVVSACHS